MRELLMVSVQSAKEDADSHSTIRKMKKLLPSVRALRSQFETKSSTKITTTTVSGVGINKESPKDSSKVRKWKSTSNFLQDPLELDKSRSRSSSMGSLEEISSSSAASCSCSSSSCSSSMSTSSKGGGKKHANYNSSSSSSNNSPAVTCTSTAQEVHPASTIIQSIVVPANGDKESSSKEFDMYRPRHSTAQWNPVGPYPYRL